MAELDIHSTWARFAEAAALRRAPAADDAAAERAFRLFTGGGDGPIGLARLRAVAAELKEDVGDGALRAMLDVAAGGRAVGLREFTEVMRRAGAL